MSNASAPSPLLTIAGLGEIAHRYDALLCDVWGVVHNGKESFPEAAAALTAFRRQGGAVVLITNAPRPNAPIHKQLGKLGVGPEAYDSIVTSGDVTSAMIAERIDQPVYYIGPERDLGLFEAAQEITGKAPVRASLEEAAYALCTGLVNDEIETPADYEQRLQSMKARGLPFLCANPDIIIHRGADLVYCAGALARRYEEIGGSTVYAGKPHAPIYGMALAAAERALGRDLPLSRVLAIGDGMRTDIAGAVGQGLDALFIRAGIHRDELTADDADGLKAQLHALCEREGLWPFASAQTLTF